MRILITGGAGFIGSTIAEQCVSAGHDVTVYDNLTTGNRANVPATAGFIEGDIRDSDRLLKAFKGIDVVVHQAARVSVPDSIADPVGFWDVNVVGTRCVLESARRCQVRRVVLASTAAIYGPGSLDAAREEDAPRPASPYADNKLLNELDAAYYGQHLGVETICTRYFNVYGPRQRPDSPYAGVVSIMSAKLRLNEPLTIFGTGQQTRDFVYVEDVARTVLGFCEIRNAVHDVINIGTGEPTSLLALVDTLGRILDREPRLVHAGPRPGDVLHSVANVTRLAARTGAVPATPLDWGLSRTLDWIGGSVGQIAL
ncbi:MAG: NAD-dependent dehydratase [Cyanobacteria bacterium RYN_339]|nr:NAD-dependent dehydratase [Cyanobacteria bacterium RYN_339]